MKPIIQQLLKEVETGGQEMKLSALLGINDYIRHPYPHEEGYAATVQQLIILLAKEQDTAVRKLFFRNIADAFMYNIDLSALDFGPLIEVLDKKDALFTGNTLYILSLTYKEQYKRLISKYLTHPDETVRYEAQDALNHLP